MIRVVSAASGGAFFAPPPLDIAPKNWLWLDLSVGAGIIATAGVVAMFIANNPSAERFAIASPPPQTIVSLPVTALALSQPATNPFGSMPRSAEVLRERTILAKLEAAPKAARPAPQIVPPQDLAVVETPLPPSRPIASNDSPIPFPTANPFRVRSPAPAPAKVAAIDPRPEPTPIKPETKPEPPAPMAAPVATPAPVAERPVHLTRAQRRAAERQQRLAAAAPKTDDRNFFQKLFDAPAQPNGSALAYARPDDGVTSVPATSGAAHPPAAAGNGVAIYDISAHAVYLPSGEALEAHSGLGDLLDNPSYVHVRNRGATPPHLYNLTLREQSFHGVQALRLTPADGASVYGRAGLLAHSFMLGPRGDSNGCVSFRNYPQFLQAYMRGDVKQLVVVTHRGDAPQGVFASRT